MYYLVLKEIKYCSSTGPGNTITHEFKPGTILDGEDRERCPEELEETFLELGWLKETEGEPTAPGVKPEFPEGKNKREMAVWISDLPEEDIHEELKNEESKFKPTRKEKAAKTKKAKRAGKGK